MTKKKQIVKEMSEHFLHWVKYNPTVVKQKFGISPEAVEMYVSEIIRETK